MIVKMDIQKIKILPMFWACPPKEYKIADRLEHFKQTGQYGRELVLDEKGWLVDGFAAYIAMLRNHEREAAATVLSGRMRPAIQCEDRNGVRDWYMVPMRIVRRIKPGSKVVLFARGRVSVMRVHVMEVFSGRPVWAANGFALPSFGPGLKGGAL